MKRALEEPARQIANNAGVEGSIVVQHVKGQKGNNGYNAATDTYEDLVKAGIIDPTIVTRSALQNAASISGRTPRRDVLRVGETSTVMSPRSLGTRALFLRSIRNFAQYT